MQEQDKKQQQHEQLDQLKQQKQQQQQPQHGPIDSPKNNQHEQDERVLNKQHRDDLQNQNIHGGHRE
ncbi:MULTISPECIES: hypothetical protein [Acinetobacter]|uniref:Uncharacterized protein n=1 Tax=Acinetobacter pseudolwoffii TaxID=2053287 RepID=N9MAI2_9GAMM|nr:MULTISPECIES: hypothetical protein [Acinetobacter]ENW23540.1 hypothetical protein F925_02498 [Acinetobacter lwoffii NCTC 5866 = CIP 64.10 = NIPH 512]NLZ87024.1 hypothetical protein [Gammaproteobacteria bacterium]ENW87671.1 hypothetical protein F906_00914 [Acinetobacter pseudolwoffii]MCP0910136.1 hypothetical protein [Acinetobacter pseudolwoffii]MDH5819422.1 hypothetical protein [Acinetobacter pseudolwoffii]